MKNKNKDKHKRIINAATKIFAQKGFFQAKVADIAKEAHSDEALLATLAIIIWHFYNVHFNPHDPMQKTWMDGKMTRKQMKHHHPGELEDIDNIGQPKQ